MNSKFLIALASSTDDFLNKNESVRIVVNALNWVITALMIIGISLVTINAIRAGIARSRADSPEAVSKNNKKLINCLIGLAIMVTATIIVQVLAVYIPQWVNQNLGQ